MTQESKERLVHSLAIFGAGMLGLLFALLLTGNVDFARKEIKGDMNSDGKVDIVDWSILTSQISK